MRLGRVIFVGALLVAVTTVPLLGQNRAPRTIPMRAQGGMPGPYGGRDPVASQARQSPLGKYTRATVSQREQLQRVLAASSPRYKRQYEIASLREQRFSTPAEMILDNRNLLGVRSTTGRMLVQPSRFGDLSEPPTIGVPLSEIGDGTLQRAEPMSHSDYLANLSDRMAERAQKNYELGTAYFRSGNLIKAKHSFELYRELDRSSPVPFLADVLTAGESRDINRAYSSLMLALRRVETVEDLRLDKSEFFTDARRFERTLSLMNVISNQNPDQPAAFALSAYYSFLNADYGTARAAIAKAIENTKAEASLELLTKFLELVVEAQSQRAAPAGVDLGR